MLWTRRKSRAVKGSWECGGRRRDAILNRVVKDRPY